MPSPFSSGPSPTPRPASSSASSSAAGAGAGAGIGDGAGGGADSVPAARRERLQRRLRLIVAFTICWNVVEAAVALLAGTHADSAALIGFGLDSVIEVLSAAAVAWQFSSPTPQARERTALSLIAVSFFGLAAYTAVEATLALAGVSSPEHSPLGLTIAALSLMVMPALALAERRTGLALGSASAVADSRQTLVCAYLSAALLLGLAAHSLLGWWWADSVAALVIAALAAREGLEAWRGECCCGNAVGILQGTADTEDSPGGCGGSCGC